MPTEAQDFLETEEAVSELLDHLESLKKEIETYKTGRVQLEEQLKDLRAFAEQLGALAKTSQDILRALGQIGTPAILARMTEFKALIEPMPARFEEITAGSLDRLAGIEATVANTRTDLLAKIEQLEVKTGESLQKSGDFMGDKLSAFQSLLHAGLADVKSGLRKYVRRLTMLSIITPAIATIIILAFLIFGK